MFSNSKRYEWNRSPDKNFTFAKLKQRRINNYWNEQVRVNFLPRIQRSHKDLNNDNHSETSFDRITLEELSQQIKTR